jgi:3-hydroxybutyryl-CoA dehydrogenase
MDQSYFNQDADAYFDCCYDTEGFSFSPIDQQPIFVHSLIDGCSVLPENAIRINAWDGFLSRPIWELAAGNDKFKMQAEAVLKQMNIGFAWVMDQPGLIAARVIAMVINEAFFAYGDGVSTKKSIDTAMKLGTNYPFGPFEWADKIGLGQVVALLNELSKSNNKYQPAPKLLEALISQNNPNAHSNTIQ